MCWQPLQQPEELLKERGSLTVSWHFISLVFLFLSSSSEWASPGLSGALSSPVSASHSGHLTVAPLVGSCCLSQCTAESILLFWSCLILLLLLQNGLSTGVYLPLLLIELGNYQDFALASCLGLNAAILIINNNLPARTCSSISPPST